MPIEKSAGAIIFKKEEEIFYLVLHCAPGARRPIPYWDLPKGHVEKGEKLEETAKREVFEETGLNDLEFIEGFKETIRYFFKADGKNILKFVTFFLTETKSSEITISFEHIGFRWLAYSEALDQLTYKNTKEIFKKANKFLCNGKK